MRRTRTMLLTIALAAGLFGLRPATADHGLPHFEGGPTHFATMSDGTSIALNVVGKGDCAIVHPTSPSLTPPSFANRCPVILEMAGYENGSSNADGRTTLGQLEDWGRENGYTGPPPPLTEDSHSNAATAARYDGEYVLVHASVRGTGCSAGEFDLFSYRSSLDGYEIIEQWLPSQTWHAPGVPVGIIGHSYSGITGFLVAALEGKAKREGKPSSLTAVSVSGLIDDLYRGITYPGGVANLLFPPLWTLGVRPAYDVLGGQLQGVFRNVYSGRPEVAAQCLANIATHRRTVLNDPIVQGIADTDNDWWRARSLVEKAPLIAHPIHMSGAFQDEQTGPRFAHLWEVVPDGVPKRLLMSNGDHGTQTSDGLWQDRKAWMDCWINGASCSSFPDNPSKTWVRTLLERKGNATVSGNSDSVSFPDEDSTWTRWYMNDQGGIVEGLPQPSGSAMYVSGSKRQSWSYQAGEGFGQPVTTSTGPDELRFSSAAFTEARVMNGPIVADLDIQSTANDFEIFVQVADLDIASGNLSIIQRGMLRASHRLWSAELSDWTEDGAVMYRPFHPHTNPTDVIPGELNHYTVEVFPAAWVFRPGHALVVKIMAPPAVDSYYAYPTRTVPVALNTLHFSPEGGSRLTIPFVPVPDGLAAAAPACGSLDSVRCVSE